MANPDHFDPYFLRADADRDGRISGAEAVAFFQGANLPREVLAKIWQYADQGQTGFLSRPEFYNALKLVTVAQTGRELTPAIVNNALHGPAAAQIPPPKIQLPPAAPHVAQPPGAVRPVRPLGPGTPQYPQYPTGPLQPGNLPSGPRPTVSVVQPPLSRTPTLPSPSAQTGNQAQWPNNKSSSWSGPTSNNNLAGQNFQAKPSAVPSSQVTQDAFGGSSFQAPKAPSAGNARQPGPDLFGGDVFTAVPVKPPLVSTPAQSNLQPPQPRPSQTTVLTEPAGLALVPTSVAPPAASKQLQPVAQPTAHTTSAGRSQGVGAPSGVDGGNFWPRMTESVVRRYTNIFIEVDRDRDGKITGEQARDLFLSWHLPREALKQIWDLSDQDHDSMLSMREFCTALYLMERYREGRTLPAAVPPGVYFDESGVQALRIAEAQVAVAQHSAGYNVPAWQQNPSVLQATGHVVPGLPPRPVLSGPLPPQVQAPAQAPVQAAGGAGLVSTPSLQPKSKAPVLEMNFVNQLNADDQLTLQTKHQEAVDAEKKVHELENQIMDSKEKMEFYRTKMQDIVLFKTRCDNRLAEITERAAADKREVESLAKRYDEKFKQAGESHSRLLIDEAAFRDIQERRLELYNAIVRMEQGGDNNALLQSRADRLHNDLDELRKALNAKCKNLKLRVKPTALIELPYGWQPGIQENAAQWDEDWDKFDDEGFEFVQEFMEEGTAGSVAAKPNSVASWDDSSTVEDGFDFSSGDVEEKLPEEKLEAAESPSSQQHGSLSPRADSDDGVVRNGDISPRQQTSPSSQGHPGSSIFNNCDETGKEPHSHDQGPASLGGDGFGSDSGDWPSVFSRRSDDMDSGLWGKSDSSNTKATGKANSITDFGFGESFDMPFRENFPSLGPVRTKNTSSFAFDNSVPSTPLHNNASPAGISNAGFFDNHMPGREQIARFDSFSSSVNDAGHPPDNFGRFDSFSSVRGSGQARGFTSFDESDPFAGTGPFGTGQTPKRSTDTWSAFS